MNRIRCKLGNLRGICWWLGLFRRRRVLTGGIIRRLLILWRIKKCVHSLTKRNNWLNNIFVQYSKNNNNKKLTNKNKSNIRSKLDSFKKLKVINRKFKNGKKKWKILKIIKLKELGIKIIKLSVKKINKNKRRIFNQIFSNLIN